MRVRVLFLTSRCLLSRARQKASFDVTEASPAQVSLEGMGDSLAGHATSTVASLPRCTVDARRPASPSARVGTVEIPHEQGGPAPSVGDGASLLVYTHRRRGGSIPTSATTLAPAGADAQLSSPAAVTAGVAARSTPLAAATALTVDSAPRSTLPAASFIDRMTKTVGTAGIQPPQVPKRCIKSRPGELAK
jgi:hypothetical protein